MAIDAFLKIDGIAGESADAKHPGEIDVESYSLAVQNTPSPGTPEFTDVSFVARTSKATVPLLMAVATGQQLPNAWLTLRRAGEKQQEFYSVTFSEVKVRSMHQAVDVADPYGPRDAFSLGFSKVQWTYRPQNADGSLGAAITRGFDLTTGQPLTP